MLNRIVGSKVLSPHNQGVQGAPGGSWLHLATKRAINISKNGLKPWFSSIQSVSRPKKGGSYSFLRHLGPFGCITTAIFSENINLTKAGFQEKITQGKSQTTWCNFQMIWHFPTPPKVPRRCEKLPKKNWLRLSLYKRLFFLFRISRKNLKPFSKIFFFILAYLSTLTFIQFSEKKY